MHGDVVVLGAARWRVQDISPDRVTVTPGAGRARASSRSGTATPSGGRSSSAGRSARSPARSRRTWRRARRAARGAASGCGPTTTSTSSPPRTCSPTSRTSATRPARCRPTGGSSSSASATSSATGGSCVLTPFGGRVHAPWTMALEARLQERLGLEVQTIYSDDGIAIRLPEGEASLDGVEALLFPDPEEVEDLVVGRVAPVGLFASRFRENAARALLLPRRRPGHADAAVAAAPAGRGPARRRVAATAASRSSSRRTASASPTCSTCRRCARSWAASRGARSRSTASRRPRRRRSRAACCSTTSRPTCTRATRRWPSAGRRR